MSLGKLAARRSELIQRIAQQRDDIVLLTQAVKKPLRLIDQGYDFIQKIKQQPKLVLAGTFLIATIFRKPLLRRSAMILGIAKWFLLNKR